MNKHLKCWAAAGLMALFMGTAAAAPQAMFQKSAIVAEAADQVYGDYEYKVESDGTVTLTKYKGSATVINNIPTKIGGRTVTRLQKTFASYVNTNNKKITKVTIPGTITEIGDETFYWTEKLTAVTFSSASKITKIGSKAFFHSGITSLPSFTNVTSISEYAFQNCANLKSFTWPGKVKTIPRGTFDSSGLTTITNLNSVTAIGEFAFSNTNLTSIALGNVTSIGQNAFCQCKTLVNVSITKDCTLANNAFDNCAEIVDVKMTAKTFKSGIEKSAFSGCTKLTKINGSLITRQYPSGEPYFLSTYNSLIRANFAKIDQAKVGFYNDFLNAEVAYIVKTQTTGCKTDGQKIKKLHDWVCGKVDYAFVGEGENRKPDPSDECHVDSSVFMRDTTVCDGYARALTLLLRKANIEAHFISGTATGGGHAWVIVKLGGRYFHVDPTWDDMTGSYTYFLKSDVEFKALEHISWSVKVASTRIPTITTTTPKCPYSVGDVNKDGLTNGADKALITKHVAKIKTIPSADLVLADVNLDGVIDISDAVKLNAMYGDMGDANRDGKVDSKDVTRILLAVRGSVTLNMWEKALADVNYDGRITTEDATILSRAIQNDEVYLL